MSELSKEQREVLDMFLKGVTDLEEAVAGLTEEQLDLSLGEGEWSIRHIVHHVAEDGDAWSMNIKKALATPGARVRFEDFPGNDAWAAAMGYGERPVENSLALLKAHRNMLAEAAAMFPERWEQSVTIVDSDGKDLARPSVRDMLAGNEGHLHDHIQIIKDIRAKHGV